MAKNKNVAVEGSVESRKSVTMNEFVSGYMKVHSEGGTKDDLAKLLGLKPLSVASRVKSYSEKFKIALPELASVGRGRKVDVGAANALIAELTAKYAAEKAAKDAAAAEAANAS